MLDAAGPGMHCITTSEGGRWCLTAEVHALIPQLAAACANQPCVRKRLMRHLNREAGKGFIPTTADELYFLIHGANDGQCRSSRSIPLP